MSQLKESMTHCVVLVTVLCCDRWPLGGIDGGVCVFGMSADRYFSSVVHTGDALEPTASSAPATVVVPSPSSQPPASPVAKSQP